MNGLRVEVHGWYLFLACGQPRSDMISSQRNPASTAASFPVPGSMHLSSIGVASSEDVGLCKDWIVVEITGGEGSWLGMRRTFIGGLWVCFGVMVSGHFGWV